MPSQDPAKQKGKAASELPEALQGSSGAAEALATVSQHASIQAKYFQAEDLVLRAIQAEYGATVTGQVTAGADMVFDGEFVSNGRMTIVEVKYIAGSAANTSKLGAYLDRLANTISRYGWRNVQIISALVLEKSENVAKANARLQTIVEQSPVPVVMRCYSFTELQQRSGVGGAEGVTN